MFPIFVPGHLSREMKGAFATCSERFVENMMKHLDRNHDGKFDWVEFALAFAPIISDDGHYVPEIGTSGVCAYAAPGDGRKCSVCFMHNPRHTATILSMHVQLFKCAVILLFFELVHIRRALTRNLMVVCTVVSRRSCAVAAGVSGSQLYALSEEYKLLEEEGRMKEAYYKEQIAKLTFDMGAVRRLQSEGENRELHSEEELRDLERRLGTWPIADVLYACSVIWVR